MNVTNVVMIAEDDHDDYHFFESALHEIDEAKVLIRAEDGVALIRLLDDSVPDILFLDMLMPYKDGRQCIREIRNDNRYDQLPVIIYTSYHAPDAIEACHSSGANLYAFKPDTYNELKNILQQIFEMPWHSGMAIPPLNSFVLR